MVIRTTLESRLKELTQAVANGNLDVLDELQNLKMQIDKRSRILEQHEYSIEQGKDGRWRTKIRLPNGKTKDIKKTERSDLEDFLIQHYETADLRKTVRGIGLDWLDEREEFSEIKPPSLSKYRSAFRRFFKEEDAFCEKEIRDVTEADLELFIKRQIVNCGLTRKTYGDLRILIMGIFKRAKRHKLTSISITGFFGDLVLPDSIFTRAKKKTDEEEVFNDIEEAKLLSALRKKPTLQKLGVVLMFQTGLRVGELSALKRSDIDLKRMCITINRTEIQYDDKDGHRVVTVSDEAKTDAGERTVFIPEGAKRTLQNIIHLSPFQEWLFSYGDGRRIRSKAFNDQLKRTCKAVGIPQRSSHKIRKTYASTLIDGGAGEKLIQKQLGHKDFSTTRKYYSRDRMADQEKVETINRIVNM